MTGQVLYLKSVTLPRSLPIIGLCDSWLNYYVSGYAMNLQQATPIHMQIKVNKKMFKY